MPLKKGSSPEVLHANIKELVSAGHDPKQAIAIALAHKMKYAEGGMVDEDDDDGLETNNDESAHRSLNEIQIQGMEPSQDVMNPEMEEHNAMLAKALYKKSAEHDKLKYADGGQVPESDGQSYAERFQKGFLGQGKAMGGLIEGEHDLDLDDGTEEPMSDEPKGLSAEKDTMGQLSEAAKLALAEKKKRRRFF